MFFSVSFASRMNDERAEKCLEIIPQKLQPAHLFTDCVLICEAGRKRERIQRAKIIHSGGSDVEPCRQSKAEGAGGKSYHIRSSA